MPPCGPSRLACAGHPNLADFERVLNVVVELVIFLTYKRGYIGIMETKVDTTILGLQSSKGCTGFRKGSADKYLNRPVRGSYLCCLCFLSMSCYMCIILCH